MTATTPPKPQDGEMPDDCRKEFEDWFSNSDLDCPSLQKSSRCNGDYRLIQTQTAWNVWQGCWNNRTSSIAEGLANTRTALALHHSMILAGEQPTETSERLFYTALSDMDSMIKEAGRDVV